MIETVVVPTYNRGASVAQTVEHVLRSRLPPGVTLEIIVVDDGSAAPAAGFLSPLHVPPPFTLSVLRTANSGPGAARNAGFRAARGRVVLFVDDDILVRPDLVARHLEAHDRFPRTVVFGYCPFATTTDTPLLRYMNAHVAPPGAQEYLAVDHVASGHLSLEREQFAASGGVYREDLRTPAAEEFELSYRLRQTGVPVVFAAGIVGIHLQPVELAALCDQQYKYGVGLAEAAAKCDELKGMAQLQIILAANESVLPADAAGTALRKRLKGLLGRRSVRARAARAVRLLEATGHGGRLLDASYRALLGSSFYAGLREGRRLYSAS